MKTADIWDGADSESWQRHLHVPAIYLFETIDSTNNFARKLADEGADALTLVIADQQTSGRGRGGRSWISAPGSSLLFSLIFRGRAGTGAAPGAAPVRIGNAVAEAIESNTSIPAMLKWPNDIVVAGIGKVGGILCEGALRQDGSSYIIAGIGINVHTPAPGYASLSDVAGTAISRAEVLTATIAALRSVAPHINDPLSEGELNAIARRDILLDQMIENDDGLRGQAIGIQRDGSLSVKTTDGVRAIRDASIRLADSGAYPGARR